MDAKIQLSIDEKNISPVAHFTDRWGINCGLADQDALRFAIALEELVSNIIQFAYPKNFRGHIELTYHHTYSDVEVVITEVGQPFDPDRHRYDPRAGIEKDQFEGAGLRLIRRFTDEFIFINKGKEGKEFRLSKRIKIHDIDLLLERARAHRASEIELEGEAMGEETFHYNSVEPADAEDIAKLIYSAYEYAYSKEDLYFPKKIEKTLWGKEKLGVIARTSDEEAVGYFAIQFKEDSNIGEVREAVVSPEYRRRGIMSRMMQYLIDMAHDSELNALYGIAVTVHPVSQKVNAKFEFKTTALMLAATTNITFRGFEEHPQPGSLVIDFLPIGVPRKKTVYLPAQYSEIIRETYEQLNIPIAIEVKDSVTLDKRSDIELKMDYTKSTSLIIVHRYGSDFRTVIREMLRSLEEQKDLHSIFLDIPLENPATPNQWDPLEDLGFIYSGLAPFFHGESDYLRLQKVYSQLDLDLIDVYSDFGKKIKSLIAHEYSGHA